MSFVAHRVTKDRTPSSASSIRTAPRSTRSPAATWTSATDPSRGAAIAISIFIDSRTTNVSPAATVAPGSTRSWTTVPGIGASSDASPAPAASASAAAGANRTGPTSPSTTQTASPSPNTDTRR